MFETPVTLLAIIFISFLPVVFWGYTFSYIDEALASRKRFILGVLAGIVSVVPVLYFDRILSFFSLEQLNVFYFAHSYGSVNSFFGLNISLLFILALILGVSFLSGRLTTGEFAGVRVFLRNFLVFIGAFVGISLLFLVLKTFFDIYPTTDFILEGASFGTLVFNSIKLVIFYYFLIAILEEASKHFHFLSTGVLSGTDAKVAVLYAIFVALGFSFVENILYLYGLYLQNGFDFALIKLYFYRSTFALFVHILCSSVLAYSFALAFIKTRNFFSWTYVYLLFSGIIASILLHAIFDISLTLGFSFVMFFYFIGGYLYVTSIFYREE